MLEWLLSKRQEITSVGKEVEKRETLYTVGGNVNWCSHCGKQYGVSQKIKNRTISNSTSGCLSEENKNPNSKRFMHPMFSAALFTIANIWKTT